MPRKSKYETNVKPRMPEIQAWVRDGLSEEQIAHNCNVAASTWYEYKNRYPELMDAVARTKNIVDNVEMVNAYFRRAIGYTVTETKREYIYVDNEATGKRERVLYKETEQEKHIPGDPRAQENWLRMRQKATWGNVIDVNSNDSDSSGIVLLPAVLKEGDNNEE